MLDVFVVGGRNSLPLAWKLNLRTHRPRFRLQSIESQAEVAAKGIIETRPDIVLVDTELEGGQALEACKSLVCHVGSATDSAKIVALSPKLDDDERSAFISAGADGYILKSIDIDSMAIALDGIAYSGPDDGEDTPLELGNGNGDRDPVLASRREVLGWVAVGAAVAAVPLASVRGAVSTAEAADDIDAEMPENLSPLPPAIVGESYLLRMQRELREALQKPVAERRWVMVIDLRKCIGCDACTIACIAENHLPPGVVYRPVIKTESGTYPNVKRKFLPQPCMQCDNPPCVPVCPVGATWKREDGIVTTDYDKCIGAKFCITACPYSARTFDTGRYYTDGTPKRQQYEKEASFEYNRKWKRKKGSPPVGKARKCQFCLHRLNAGRLPACVATCIGHATFFGDANNAESLAYELINQDNVVQLKKNLRTRPKVYYLV